MTALVHGVVVSLPDNPAYEVSKNAWNQAHPLPGTIGQLFASDGAAGISAIPQIVYDSVNGSMNIGVDSGLGGGVLQIYDVQGFRGMFAFDATQGNLSADKLMPVTPLSGLLELGGPANLWKNLWLSDGLILGSIPAITDAGAGIGTFLRGDGTWAAVMAGSMTGAATEVLVSDGAGNAAGSPDLTFDAGSKTLTMGSGGSLVGTIGLTVGSEATFASALTLIDDGSFFLGGGSLPGALFSGSATGDALIANSALSAAISVFGASGTIPNKIVFGPDFIPDTNNVYDIGGTVATIGSDKLMRTGYFGTSVVAPTFKGDTTNGLAVLTLGTGTDGTFSLFGGPFAGAGLSVNSSLEVSILGQNNYITLNSDASTVPNLIVLHGTAGPDAANVFDSGTSDNPWATGYFGTSVVSAAYVVGASPGIDATVTTADLVGKTLTFVKGICTGYA